MLLSAGMNCASIPSDTSCHADDVCTFVQVFLNLHGYTYVRLDGTTKPEQRQILMQRYNTNPKLFIFILSTRSGGVGMNLTGADTVIFYDSDWNPAMDAQVGVLSYNYDMPTSPSSCYLAVPIPCSASPKCTRDMAGKVLSNHVDRSRGSTFLNDFGHTLAFLLRLYLTPRTTSSLDQWCQIHDELAGLRL